MPPKRWEGRTIVNPLTRKLEHFVKLSEDDRRALDAMAGQHVRDRGARVDIIGEGERPACAAGPAATR